MYAKQIIIALVLLIFSVACGNESGDRISASYIKKPLESNEGENDGSKSNLSERKLIKEAFLRFKTDEPKKIKQFISNILSVHKGYIESETSYKESDKTIYTMQIRVPSGKYEYILDKIENKAGKLDSKEVKVKDVSDEYIDTETRLKNKKLLEAKYQELLKKANVISEIMEIEREINILREEIESVESRFKLLQSKINYSQIELNYYEMVSTEVGFGGKLVQSFSNGWSNMLAFVILLMNLWPFFLIIIIVIFIVLYSLKKHKK